MRALISTSARVISSALLLTMPAVAAAQLSNASTAATGLSGAFTARAQGYNAVYWNPANLAMPGNPGFSLSIGAIDGTTGIRPIDFTDVKPYSGKYVPYSVREEWLASVEAEGAQRGNLAGGVTAIGLSLGTLAFPVS